MNTAAPRLQQCREAVAAWEALAPQRRDACTTAERDTAAAAYRALGAAEAAAGTEQAALDAWARAIGLYEQGRGDPADANADARDYKIAALHLSRAELLRARDAGAAVAAFEGAIGLWQALRARASALYTPELADLLAHSSFEQARLLLAAADPAGAARAAERATATWSAAAADAPEPEPTRLDALANGYGFQGAALRMLGESAAARTCFAQAATLWDSLQQQLGAATPPGLLQRLALARQQIDELDAPRH